MKQHIQSSHTPPRHRYMVIATTLIVQCFAMLHCSANQPVPNVALSSSHKAIECILG